MFYTFTIAIGQLGALPDNGRYKAWNSYVVFNAGYKTYVLKAFCTKASFCNHNQSLQTERFEM